MTGRPEAQWPRRGKAALLGLVFVVIAVPAVLWVLDRTFPVPIVKAEDLSRTLLAADGVPLRVTLTQDHKVRLPVRVGDVDPLFVRMLTAYEDRRFRWHWGVDPLAVARALGQWAASGSVVSGASTITMQVARLLEPRPRTLGGKLLEMARAVQLELHLSKDEILRLYLTLAPYGGNLEGIRAASLAWLGKEPKRLTEAEAALLVVFPQAPARLRPDRYPERARAARDKVLKRAAARGVLTRPEARLAMLDDVPRSRRPLPFHAPHLADRLFAARAATKQPMPLNGTTQGVADRLFAAGAATAVRTTLDASLQARLEALAAAHAAKAGPDVGVALLAADHRDAMAVRAWVGSSDYLSRPRLGAVDMVRAVRSPGSTLKPFVYGLAFDRALAHPRTRLVDEFRRFGAWRPNNFDGRYHGEVTIADALRLSLNIPAVAVMERLGPRRFAHALAAAGVALTLPPGERPGLAVTLGGAGLTLEQLVMLYGALGADGQVRPLRLYPEIVPARPGVPRARDLGRVRPAPHDRDTDRAGAAAPLGAGTRRAPAPAHVDADTGRARPTALFEADTVRMQAAALPGAGTGPARTAALVDRASGRVVPRSVAATDTGRVETAALPDADTARAAPAMVLNPDAASSAPAPLLNPDTARTVAAILKSAAPPPGLAPARLLANAPEFAAKTGTSYGFRDAWALGVDGRYVVGVWVGRVDGAPRPGRMGRDEALPLLHAVFGLLPPDPGRRLPEPQRPISEPAPLGLRHFDPPATPRGPRVAALSLDFPPDGATLKLSRRGRFRALPLNAKGGARPYRWLVNGRPLDGMLWRPDGPGAATLTALDASGQSARATVWVE